MNTKNSRKWKIGWGVTSKCNMRCGFCYSQSIQPLQRSDNDDVQSHLRFVLKNKDIIDSINWGTKENAISDKWFELVEKIHAIAPGIVQGVTTNGLLGERCKENASFFRTFRNCIQDVDVSLDFANPAKHNAFRGHDRAFQLAMGTLELCAELNIPRSIVAIGTEENLDERNIDGLFKIAAQFESNVRINILRPVKGCDLGPVKYETLKAILLYIIKHFHVVSLADPLVAALMGLSAIDPSGVGSFRILPDGDVTPSTYLTYHPWLTTNIFTERVDIEKLHLLPAFRELARAKTPARCDGCQLARKCQGGCKDRRIIWFNTLAERDPYCPLRHDGNLEWLGNGNLKVAAVSAGGPLIHNGYLPTLIFRS